MVHQIVHHHQPINVPTAGAQAFPMDGIGRLGHDPPRGPSADWRVLTIADTAGTNGLTCLPKHGGARDRRFLVTHPMTDHCENCLNSTIAAERANHLRHRAPQIVIKSLVTIFNLNAIVRQMTPPHLMLSEGFGEHSVHRFASFDYSFQSGGGGGKKNRQKERRLMKGFNIAPGGSLTAGDEFLASLHHEHGGAHGAHHASLSALLGARLRTSQSSLSDGGAAPPPASSHSHSHSHSHGRRKPAPHKRRWGTIIEAARAARVSRFIGRSRSEDSVCDHSRHSPSGSERSESGSDSQRSPERGSGRITGPLHPLSALAALKRKRKKFSDSRRAAEEEARASGAATAGPGGTRGAGPEALQRASSVPARAPPTPAPAPAPAPPRAPPAPPAPSSAPATARGGSREPLLASLDEDAHKEACGECGMEASEADEAPAASKIAADAGSGPGAGAGVVVGAGESCGRCAALTRLAGVTPLHGHAPHNSAGWL
ncbi:hypothetical protein evm_012816 [Chilo suppressalis]|nr:hypothetical protein evm_012816 [Chilo suppressalis]